MNENEGKGDGELGEFKRDLHLQYFNWMLHQLPGAYAEEESSRLTLAYFVISSLDILGALDTVAVDETIDWVYGLQVLPLSSGDFVDIPVYYSDTTFGFRGSSSVGVPFDANGAHPIQYDGGHLAMTYSALAILTILGDNLSKVSRDAVLGSMQTLQQPDGSFSPTHMDKVADLRFVFCAAAISTILDDWSGFDRQKAVEFIIKSQSYEGGFSLSPGLESHGGATYCALSALWLITQFDSSWPSAVPLGSLVDLEHATSWCLQRQAETGGFQGRVNKPADTCYAFWIGGSLRTFDMDHLVDQKALRVFLLSCQSKWGGFSKFPHEGSPDLLHSYYGICGFSLLAEPGLEPLVFGLGLTNRSASRLSAFNRKQDDEDSLGYPFLRIQIE